MRKKNAKPKLRTSLKANPKLDSDYRISIDQAPDGIFIASVNGDIKAVNHRSCSMLGYQERELLSKNLYDLVSPRGNILRPLELQRLGKGENIIKERQLRCKNGLTLSTEINAKMLEDGSIQGFFKDISKRKQVEKKFKTVNNELDTFMYKASHNLKGPVATLLGLASMAKMELVDEHALKYVSMFEKSTSQLQETLEQLLEITHIKQKQLQITSLNCHLFLDQIIQEIGKNHLDKNLDIRSFVQREAVFNTDLELFSLIVNRLVENSLKFRHQDRATSIKIQLDITNEMVQMKIKDNGKGIPNGLKSKIFDMFFRGDCDSEGLGLGLFSVKKAIERLMGRIEVTSSKTKGTTFLISLPIKRQAAS